MASSITFTTSNRLAEDVQCAACTVEGALKSALKKAKDPGGKVFATSKAETSGKLGAVRHSFVDSIIEAYSYHHNLMLRPDDFWGAILILFSQYVQANAEELRHLFVEHEGQKKLTVETEGTMALICDPHAVSEFATQMATLIQKNLKDPAFKDLMVPHFSTTGVVEEVAFSVMLMATAQAYFSYGWCLCCGIPQVTLLGTEADWDDLLTRVSALPNHAVPGDDTLSNWVTRLVPIFEKLASSRRGVDETDFWASCCTIKSFGSDTPRLSGWVAAFCSFTDTEIETDAVPRAILSVPVNITDGTTILKTMMFAGGFAYDVLEDKKTIRPRLDWALTEATPGQEKGEKEKKNVEMKIRRKKRH